MIPKTAAIAVAGNNGSRGTIHQVPKGSFGHCGHTGQSIFFSREKKMCVVILTNATRCLNKRSGFKGYDYGIVCKMREEIHNAIKNDLTLEGIL